MRFWRPLFIVPGAKLRQAYDQVRASYWFIPTVMAVAAIGLAGMGHLGETLLGSGWMENISWLSPSQPDDARTILATIATSMMTVAGVAFSVTIVAVSYASGQFGPRLIRNFMKDRGNQVTLGTFIATFVYCILTLQGVSSAHGEIEAIVPDFALLIALALAGASLGVLIYFIHHVPETINISNIAANVGMSLKQQIGDLFPNHVGKDWKQDDEKSQSSLHEVFNTPTDKALILPVLAPRDGYIQTMDYEKLLSTSKIHHLLIRVQYRPGDFVNKNEVLLWAAPHPDAPCEENAHDDENDLSLDQIQACFAIGQERTSAQNIFFLVDELCEIIARALSPGVNDPFTSISCMDWLQVAIVQMGQRELPTAERKDDAGIARVIAHPITFEKFVSRALDQIMPYVAADRNAALHMMRIILQSALQVKVEARQQVLVAKALRLRSMCERSFAHAEDLKELRERSDVIEAIIGKDAAALQHLNSQDWVGGSA